MPIKDFLRVAHVANLTLAEQSGTKNKPWQKHLFFLLFT